MQTKPLTNEEADWLLSLSDADLEESLSTFPESLQAEILKQLMDHRLPQERATDTPADFAAYISNGQWRIARHLAILNRELMDIATGKNRRLIVEMPPRHGKSELTSKYFPAWYMGSYPEKNIIVTSATDDLASEFSSAGRDILREHGKECFGVEVRRDKSSAKRWSLKQGGEVRAAGVGGGIIGRGCNVLLIDDYCKSAEEALSEATRRHIHQWYHSTSSTRLTPDGAVVIVATRWHPKDLIGSILAEAEQTGESWRRVRFPAIDDDGLALWPEQWGLDNLIPKREAYHASGYPWMWEALYQQQPPSVLDAEFDQEWFDDDIWFDEWPDQEYRLVATSLDPSLGKTNRSDYSAFVTGKLDMEGTVWIDADLARRDPVRMVEDGIDIWEKHHPISFGVESVGFQEVLGMIFEEWSKKRTGIMLPLVLVSNHENKKVRIRKLTPYLARKQFKFKRTPGCRLLVEQLRTFPANKHDDGPDALEMLLRLLLSLLNGENYEDTTDPIFDNVFA